MTLHRVAKVPSASQAVGSPAATARTSLFWRLSAITVATVALVLLVMTAASFFTVSQLFSDERDRSLESKAVTVLERVDEGAEEADTPQAQRELWQSIVDRFKAENPDVRISLSGLDWEPSVGDGIPIEESTLPAGQLSVHNEGRERIGVMRSESGATVVLAQSLESQYSALKRLAVVLSVVALGGLVVAAVSGVIAALVGVHPIARLQRAIDRVTRTGELRPLRVEGENEIAELTRSFNAMVAALEESRLRQVQMVAEASHELRTPLTSLRTNVELAIMASKDGAVGKYIPIDEQHAMRDDVLAQLEELSTLVGELADLAREDEATGQLLNSAPVDAAELINQALERVRRRRPDVHFEPHGVEPVPLEADSASLERALVNVLHNAAKWSPKGGTVDVRMAVLPRKEDHQGDHPNKEASGARSAKAKKSAKAGGFRHPKDRRKPTGGTDGGAEHPMLEITVADQGPGIPEEDREHVFERFYRAVAARSTPGSGLGLAIVKQVVERHGGTVRAEEAPSGGALLRMRLPLSRHYAQ